MALVACPTTARQSRDSKATGEERRGDSFPWKKQKKIRQEIRSLGRNRRRTVIIIHSVVGDVSGGVGELQNQAKNENPCGGGAR